MKRNTNNFSPLINPAAACVEFPMFPRADYPCWMKYVPSNFFVKLVKICHGREKWFGCDQSDPSYLNRLSAGICAKSVCFDNTVTHGTMLQSNQEVVQYNQESESKPTSE